MRFAKIKVSLLAVAMFGAATAADGERQADRVQHQNAGAQNARDAQAVTGPDREQEIQRLYSVLVAPQNMYPASVVLGVTGTSRSQNWFCNGVLVKPQWVLTSAHCVQQIDTKALVVFYGAPDLARAQEAPVAAIVVRDEYSGTRHTNDLALVQLAEPIGVQPIEVSPRNYAEGSNVKPGQDSSIGRAIVAGWGNMVESQRLLDGIQRHLAVRVVNRNECNQARSYAGQVPEGQFCAVSAFALVDACNGFGGAGLMIPDARGRFQLQGLVSWGDGCTRPFHYTVYTDVSRHAAWIAKTTAATTTERDPVDPALRAPSPPPANEGPTGEGRIVSYDFNVAPLGLFRYAVSIAHARSQQTLGHFCGGTLVSKSWVLTAAHCVAGKEAATLQLKVDTEKLSVGGVPLQARQIIVHEDFHKNPTGSYVNDIALIRVTGNVPTDMVLLTVLSPDRESALLATPEPGGTVIGWGRNSSSKFGQTSDYLHMASVKIVDHGTCNSTDYYDGRIDDGALCAGSEGLDACQGDSGGPLLMLEETGQFVVAGLVSWGDGCGKPNRPGVYVRASTYRQWIRDTIAKVTLR